jgi:hypothetical protein
VLYPRNQTYAVSRLARPSCHLLDIVCRFLHHIPCCFCEIVPVYPPRKYRKVESARIPVFHLHGSHSQTRSKTRSILLGSQLINQSLNTFHIALYLEHLNGYAVFELGECFILALKIPEEKVASQIHGSPRAYCSKYSTFSQLNSPVWATRLVPPIPGPSPRSRSLKLIAARWSVVERPVVLILR